ncbi:MAG TPA: ABC transporter ATP-binding protein [Acidimicrobiia bacterium]|nr:ABC transporter ATP-binding protein [Acidimicrobiia bacterium]
MQTKRSSASTVDRAAISARGASKIFESGDGVHDLDLDVAAGSIFGFIGPSGSGKTTTVRMFTGVVEPDEGTIEVLGEDPTRFDTATRSRLGYLPQLSVLYPQLTVGENLRFFAALYGLRGKRSRSQRNEVLEFVELADDEGKRVDEISGGMQRRLSLAAALVHDPEMIFLDEPTAGVDPMLRRRFWDRFTDLRDEGRTLFVTTQYVGEAAYCDQVGVLDEGRLLIVDTPDGLRRAAFGGDVIDVEFAVPPRDELVAEITEAVSASSTERRGSVLRVVVDEAATALPELTAWLSSRGVEIVGAEEHLPPYDDVFVELVERFRAQSAAGVVSDR